MIVKNKYKLNQKKSIFLNKLINNENIKYHQVDFDSILLTQIKLGLKFSLLAVRSFGAPRS